MKGKFSKNNMILWALIVIAGIGLFTVLKGNTATTNTNEISYSEFTSQLQQDKVQDVNIKGLNVTGHYTDGTTFKTYNPNDYELIKELKGKKVAIVGEPIDNGSSIWGSLLTSFLPIILLLGVWIFFMNKMGGGKGGTMGFGKSKARMLDPKKDKKTFADVAGVDEAKEEVEEIIDFLKDPAKFQRLGGKIPRGALLVGPPGTGKTLLARAIAGEASVPFFSISGSDFVEMFVGVGASRVRDMFEQAKKHSPCIIFIDEIDAVGRHRGSGTGGGNDEREQTLNQMLVEMDGFSENEGVIVIAATNRPDVLDKALLRPGRFDRRITVGNPPIKGREEILKVHSAKVPMSKNVILKDIARGTPGFSGADLANLINEAALLAARKDQRVVTMVDLENAKDKVLMGAEHRSLAMSEEEKKLTAYHEAGHALTAVLSPASDPIHKATIIPRGRALGMVQRLPEDDRVSRTLEGCLADIVVSMGGRVAEEIFFGKSKVTSGASGDIQNATSVARSMVTQWGLSEKLGPVLYQQGSNDYGSYNRGSDISEKTVEIIDAEIKRIVEEGYQEAFKMVEDNKDKLIAIAEGLLTHETLSGQEIKDLVDGKEIQREKEEDKQANTTSILPTEEDEKPTTAEETSKVENNNEDVNDSPTTSHYKSKESQEQPTTDKEKTDEKSDQDEKNNESKNPFDE